MAANRTLLLAALATLTGSPAVAQPVSLPGLLPASATEPAPVDAPPPPGPATIAPTGPTATLTAPPGVGHPPGGLPRGAVASPWVGNTPAGLGCCGPVGRNGPLTYELYGVVGVGRDWFAQGPGFLTPDCPTNWRYGWELGGRWGTGHADLEPVADRTNYLRKSGVYHGVFLGAHADVEVPMGAWLFFAGGRAQWGYDWTDFIPPQQGDIQNVNLLLELGVRF